MARYTGKKNRIARRFGVNIFGRLRNPMLHKANPPGQHGAKRRKKSDYGQQLEEKQKLKAIYGMLSEKQLVRYFKEAARVHGNTAEIFVRLMEARLDVVVYRMKLASTMFAAQQLVAHGHVQVDGKKVDIRSYQVRPGQTISIRESSRNMKCITEAMESSLRTAPAYVTLDPATFSGQYIERPTLENVSWPIEIKIAEICDFLAHST